MHFVLLSKHIPFISQSPGQFAHDLLQSPPKNFWLKHERHVLFLSHVLQFEYLTEHNTEQLAPVNELLSQLDELSKHIPFISQ